jgi:hypothetical protein
VEADLYLRNPARDLEKFAVRVVAGCVSIDDSTPISSYDSSNVRNRPSATQHIFSPLRARST